MSPYENRIHAEGFRRIGLFATVTPGHESAIADLTRDPPSAEVRAAWQAEGLSHVVVNSLATAEGVLLFAYLEWAHGSAEAAAQKVSRAVWFDALSAHLSPHARVTPGDTWMPMENINVIGPTLPLPPDKNRTQRLGLVTQLDPAAELTYRTLHQTNWPGVVDQMARSHCRYWVTFLIEIGETLWLFTYCEYVGTNRAADNAATAADPVTQRWWKHTQPCLKPVSTEPGGWTSMRSLTG